MKPHPEPPLDPDDEEINRVRATRHRISARFGHDPYRLVAHYIELQKAPAPPPPLAPEAGPE
jgi:hypothetical protein